MTKGFFITGIGTNVGKTYVAALLCKHNQWNYWKPIQCGLEEQTDSDYVRSQLSNTSLNIFPERYILKEAASPHQAAKKEGLKLKLSDFEFPVSERPVLVEGAGGLMVPINHGGETIIDLIKHLKLPVILVVNFYLGSINHTLLSLAKLKAENIPISRIVYNGSINFESKSIISELHPELLEIFIEENHNNFSSLKIEFN